MKVHQSIWNPVSLLAVFFSLFFSLNGVAQDQESSGEESTALELVVVTAQRRSTNLQTTALAVSVLSGEELIDRGAFNLVALQYAAPSMSIGDFGSANVFNIRGIGRSKVDIEIPSGVVIYQDGVPTLAGYFQNEPYYDIDAVEILRGPQGTFVGKSASGGAVFIRTNSPVMNETSGNLEGGFGNNNLWEARGYINASSSDTFAFRAAFNYANRDDYYDDIYGDYTGDPGSRDLQSLRLGFLWQPNENLTANLKVNFADLDFGGNVTSSYGDPLYTVPQDAPFAYRDETTRVVLDIDYAFDNGITFSSLTGYQTVDTINNLDVNGSIEIPVYWFESQGTIDLWSQEFNLISDEDQRFRWVLGLFFQNQKAELASVADKGFVFTGGPFYPNMAYPWLGSPWTKDEDDWAVFGQVAYDLTDALEMEVGVRYSAYEFYQITDYVFGFGTAPPTIPFGSGPGPDRQDFDEDSVDWKLGLNWDLDDMNYLYGIISRGHTWGSVNIFPPFDPYGEMEVLNYEAGWKAGFAEGQFTTQLSAYYEDIDGYQAAFTDLDLPDSAGQVQNAESTSTIYGLEFTGQARVEEFSLDFGISYNQSELGDFTNVAHPIQPPPPAPPDIRNLSGEPFPYAPTFTFNIGVSYDFALGNGSTLTPRLDYGYVNETQAELFDDPEFTIAAHGLLNAQVSWKTGNWYVVAWATNLTDKGYVAAIQNTGSLYYAGSPRQYGLRVGYNFE